MLTCLRSIGILISGTVWEMYRSRDGTSIGCLTIPAIVKFGERDERAW